MGVSDDNSQSSSNSNNTNALYTQKKCGKCGKFYTEIENNYNPAPNNVDEIIEPPKPICFYHKSQTCCSVLLSAGGQMCRVEEQGCIAAIKHEEDRGYSAVIAKFPVHNPSVEVVKQAHHTWGKKSDTNSEGKRKGVESEKLVDIDDDFVIHEVQLTDTLVGIAFYYKVKIEDIQKANNLDSHQIYHHKTLLIPKAGSPVRPSIPETEDQIKARRNKQVKLFAQRTSSTLDEARYYMETCDFDLEEAIKEWEIDSEWAHNNPVEKDRLKGAPSPSTQKVVKQKEEKYRDRRTCC